MTTYPPLTSSISRSPTILRAKVRGKAKRLQAFLDHLGTEYTISLGFFSDSTYPDGTPVPQVALNNEYGFITPEGHKVPPRPFMYPLLHNPKVTDNWKERLSLALKLYLRQSPGDLKNLVPRAYKTLALTMIGDLQQAITELSTPPNSPYTIKKKGSSNPLIDQGYLRSSVSAEVQGDRIQDTSKYSPKPRPTP